MCYNGVGQIGPIGQADPHGGTDMARSDRLTVTVSPHMMVALDVLAERTGLSRSSQAMVLLRQALDRTMGSDEVRKRLDASRPLRTVREWRRDAAADADVHNTLAGMATEAARAAMGDGAQG
jgi:hypothetical protein